MEPEVVRKRLPFFFFFWYGDYYGLTMQLYAALFIYDLLIYFLVLLGRCVVGLFLRFCLRFATLSALYSRSQHPFQKRHAMDRVLSDTEETWQCASGLLWGRITAALPTTLLRTEQVSSAHAPILC